MTFSASSKKHHIIPAVMSMHTPTVWAKMTTVSHSILKMLKTVVMTLGVMTLLTMMLLTVMVL